MPDERKPARGRAKYNDDYVRDPDGKYVYRGVYYVFPLARGALLRHKIACCAISLALLGVYAAGGVADSRSGRTFYVLIPYVAGFLPLLIAAADSFMLFTLRESGFTRKQKEQIPDQLRLASRAGAVCAACAALGALALAVFTRPDPLWPEIVFALCAAAAGVGAYLFERLQNMRKCVSRA